MKTFNCKKCGKPVPYSYIKKCMASQSKRNEDVVNIVNYNILCPNCGEKFLFTDQDNEVMKDK